MRLRFLTRHQTFLGHIAMLISGRGVAAIIALVTMPVIARLFEPADFGIAAVFLSLGVIISNVGALRYEAALVLPKQDTAAVSLMSLAYRVMLSMCTLVLVFITAYKLTGVKFEFLESLGVWLWFLPVGVLLLATIQIQESWLGRKKQFRVLATSIVAGTAVTGATRIATGLVSGSTAVGLIFGHMFGQICQLVIQRRASREDIQASRVSFDWTCARQTAIEYSDFPRMNAPAALLTALGKQMPVILFGVLFSPSIVGFYSMATRLMHAPIVIVSNSVRRVFLQKAAAIFNRGRSLSTAFLLTTGGLVILGAVPLVVLILYGQPLIVWLLGDRWSGAGRFLEIIAPWLFMLWVTAPTNPIFVVLRKQHLWLGMQFTATVARLGTFAAAYALNASPEWTLGAFVAVTVAGNVVIILTSILMISSHQRALVVNSN